MAIQKFNNFLPSDILQSIAQEIQQRGWNFGWTSKKIPSIPLGHWNMSFAIAGPENGIDVYGQLPDALKAAWDHIRTNYLPGAKLIRCYANAHTYGVEGYPHKDSNRSADKTLLVYLNTAWDRDWGGETVIYDGDDILHAEMPAYNKAIIFNGNTYHVAKGVTRICPALRTTLMFKFTTVEDNTRDRLQEFLISIGADKKKHSANTLMGHLLRTYDLLKEAGQREEVCSAGAIHSIFGTSIFKWENRLDYSSRDQVIAVAGDYATRLAEIFSKIPRPGILDGGIDGFLGQLINLEGGTISVTQQEFDDLCVIEAANLADQIGLDRHHNLQQLWKQLNNK